MSPRVAGLLVMLCAAGASAQPAVPPLPVWPGHVEGAAVEVDALDVDADLLRAVLVPRGVHYVVAPSQRTVTGRVAVKKRADALAALVRLDPTLAVAPRPMRGSGPNVDLDFRAAPTADLYRLFADVLRTNIVVLAPPTELTIRVKRKPAGGVLAEIARTAGHAIDKPASNVMVVRAATAPATPRFATGGARLRLDARRLAAGLLLELIRRLDGPRPPAELLRDASLACDGGTVLDLRLTKVATSTALAAVAHAGDVDLRGTRCALTPLPPGPTVDLKLLATVERGAVRLAAVESAKQVHVITHGAGGWEVGAGWILHRSHLGERTWQLYPSALAGDPPPPRRSLKSRVRVAATILDGAERLAIVEVDGKAQIWNQDKMVHLGDDLADSFEIVVARGEVRVRGDDAMTLYLAPKRP